MPLTSVVIIGKNEQDTIESCIMSISNQTAIIQRNSEVRSIYVGQQF